MEAVAVALFVMVFLGAVLSGLIEGVGLVYAVGYAFLLASGFSGAWYGLMRWMKKP